MSAVVGPGCPMCAGEGPAGCPVCTVSAPLSGQRLAEIRAQLGDAQPATDDLLVSFGKSIADRREHDHANAGPDWDWFCLNLSGWLGDKSAPVLRRLLDAEARVAELETERHSTNEALDEVVRELRQPRVRPMPRPPRFDGVPDAVLEAALRDFVSAHLDYDMHKYIEAPEDGSPDRYPELTQELAKGLARAAEAAGFEAEPWAGGDR